MMQDRRYDAGFTLVEMLVALAVVSLAAVLLVIGISRINLELGLSRFGDGRIGDVAAAQFTLRQRIERVFPAKDPQTGNTVDFSGREDSLDFISKAPENASPDALQRYRLKLSGDGTLTLYKISTLTTAIDPRQTSTEGWIATPLIAGVRNLNIRYFGPMPDNSGNGWQGYWNHRPALPKLVRLKVDFPEGDNRGWPDLVVRLHSANGDSCERDLRTEECKGEGEI